jgi:hypothetical protein
MVGEVSDRQSRTAVLHLRVQPALRELIEADAAKLSTTPSAIVRRVLAQHYSKVR